MRMVRETTDITKWYSTAHDKTSERRLVECSEGEDEFYRGDPVGIRELREFLGPHAAFGLLVVGSIWHSGRNCRQAVRQRARNRRRYRASTGAGALTARLGRPGPAPARRRQVGLEL